MLCNLIKVEEVFASSGKDKEHLSTGDDLRQSLVVLVNKQPLLEFGTLMTLVKVFFQRVYELRYPSVLYKTLIVTYIRYTTATTRRS